MIRVKITTIILLSISKLYGIWKNSIKRKREKGKEQRGTKERGITEIFTKEGERGLKIESNFGTWKIERLR